MHLEAPKLRLSMAIERIELQATRNALTRECEEIRTERVRVKKP
jgi:hypothetical protein